jgi:hypothetical protein
VTGTKSREVMRGFVDSTAAPTHLLGKIARWEVPICPYAVGVKPAAADFVVARVKEVAEKVGAPVSTDAQCKFNIEIVFTKTPQALLDDMKKNEPFLLGFWAVRKSVTGWRRSAARSRPGTAPPPRICAARSRSTAPARRPQDRD